MLSLEPTTIVAALQVLVSAVLVGVTVMYVRAAHRQADATEESLRLVTRQERRTAVEELEELRRQVNRYMGKMSELAHGEVLQRNLNKGSSHGIEHGNVERMRALAAGLMPLGLKSPPLVLEAIPHTRKVAENWTQTRSEVTSDAGPGGRFETLVESAKRAHEAFITANSAAKVDLRDLPERPV